VLDQRQVNRAQKLIGEELLALEMPEFDLERRSLLKVKRNAVRLLAEFR
jgi:hypothetical protein